MAINSTKIAKLAGVSRSTVSKVINNYPDIPQSTKDKVMAIINENNYKPNIYAQVLKGIAPKVICIYIHVSYKDAMKEFNSHYMMTMLSNFVYEAEQIGYSMSVEMVRANEDQKKILEKITNTFLEKRIESAVFIGQTSDDTYIDELVKRGFKLASIDRSVDVGGNSFNVITDDADGAYRATELLYKNGYKNIMHIGGDLKKLSSRSRVKGYEKSVTKHGGQIIKLNGTYTAEFGQECADIFCKEYLDKVDSIVFGNDTIATGFIIRMMQLDPQVLNKIGYIGFDDDVIDTLFTPTISSMVVDFKGITKATLQALTANSEDKDQEIPHEIHSKMLLIERDSSSKR